VSRNTKKRVLFVCVGNCCRSQMAEGFAAQCGSDILVAESAGIAPAGIIVDETVNSMAEKNIDISSHYSKALDPDQANRCDLIVNMSGFDLPDAIRAPVVEWEVPDPIGESDAVYARVRDQIERLVTQLILDLRSQQPQP
jgi:arsenate reductase